MGGAATATQHVADRLPPTFAAYRYIEWTGRDFKVDKMVADFNLDPALVAAAAPGAA